jgi:hypothetical protein
LWRHRSPDNLQKLFELQQSGLVNLDISKVSPADAFFNYGNKPDRQGEISIGGPFPLLKNSSFLFNYKQEQQAYAVTVPDEFYRDKQTFFKLQFKPFENFSVSGFYYHVTQNGIGGISGPNGYDPISQNPFDVERMDSRIWYPVSATATEHIRHTGSINFIHQLSENLKYSFQFSQFIQEFDYQQEHRNTLPIPGADNGMTNLKNGLIGSEAHADQSAIDYESWANWRDWAKIKIGEVWYDEMPWGFTPVFYKDASDFYRMASAEFKTTSSLTRTYSLKTDLSYRWKPSQHFKAGAHFYYDRIWQKFRNLLAHC